jgi:hypothetical protein
VGRCGPDSSGLGQGPVVGYYEDGYEPSGSIKGEVFRNRLSDLASREGLTHGVVINR